MTFMTDVRDVVNPSCQLCFDINCVNIMRFIQILLGEAHIKRTSIHTYLCHPVNFEEQLNVLTIVTLYCSALLL